MTVHSSCEGYFTSHYRNGILGILRWELYLSIALGSSSESVSEQESCFTSGDFNYDKGPLISILLPCLRQRSELLFDSFSQYELSLQVLKNVCRICIASLRASVNPDFCFSSKLGGDIFQFSRTLFSIRFMNVLMDAINEPEVSPYSDSFSSRFNVEGLWNMSLQSLSDDLVRKLFQTKLVPQLFRSLSKCHSGIYDTIFVACHHPCL